MTQHNGMNTMLNGAQAAQGVHAPYQVGQVASTPAAQIVQSMGLAPGTGHSVRAAAPHEFAQCAPQAAAQQFVNVPTVEHVLVEQPVTYRQYKQQTSYVPVPIPQKYSKITLDHHQHGCEQRSFFPTPTVAGKDKPVYGCGAAPFTERAFRSGMVGITNNRVRGAPFPTADLAYSQQAPQYRSYASMY